ncbi:MAG TPA: hypothetical protein VN823_22730 [Stellaceae bacterium]|nr:hypothetical protein [Stellaceae bacterium]
MKPRHSYGVHLVGSVPLADARGVFRMALEKLGDRLRRLPDGETGARSRWVHWQLGVFESMDVFESEVVDTGYIHRAQFRLKPGARPRDVAFPTLGYAKAARESYAEFARLRERGEIPAHLRFQVCLPTPLAPVTSFVLPESRAAVEPRYEERLFVELDEIVDAVPSDRLAIQWDTAYEFALLEGVMPSGFADPQAEILERLLRIGNRVPAEVELGYHLCYGDSGHRHFKDPDDTAKLALVANHLARDLARPLQWIHLPVPRARSDEAYFEPLSTLALRAETELYLGLIHFTDGLDGARRRLSAAARYVRRFGVATECGLGRRPPGTIAALLDLHARVSDLAAE